MGLLNRKLYEVIMRGRARRPHRDSEDPREDMVEAARHRTTRTRYPGELDAPGTEKYSQKQKSKYQS
jgi:hypothetical protein